jgi:hypothetical protein
MRRVRVVAAVAAAVLAVSLVGMNGAVAAPSGKGQPPRGANTALLGDCDTGGPLTVGDSCVAVVLHVTTDVMANGEYTVTLPPGTTVDPTSFTSQIDIGCSSASSVLSATGSSVKVTGVTCSSGFVVWLVAADVQSAPGTYALNGSYKVDALKRGGNVYRYAVDPSVDVYAAP